MECLPTGSGSTDIFLRRRFLFEKMQSSGYLRMKDKLDVIKTFVKIRTKCPKERTPELYKKVSLFFLDFKKKWQQSNRTHDRFLTKHKNWLDVSISFPDYTNYSKKVGRAEITFEESADRTKRKKTEAKLTRNQHNIIRDHDKERFPSYKIIQAAKKK
ncbi:hypothetical protein JTB14_036909 [Gonioctena quinquepunctata]|nr:hypothetical protein JTB14_036909 [Gonioctena quinquepunctata]